MVCWYIIVINMRRQVNIVTCFSDATICSFSSNSSISKGLVVICNQILTGPISTICFNELVRRRRIFYKFCKDCIIGSCFFCCCRYQQIRWCRCFICIVFYFCPANKIHSVTRSYSWELYCSTLLICF